MFNELKKKLRIVLCIMLSAITMVGTACRGNENTSEDIPLPQEEVVLNVVDYIVKDGSSDYKIVVSKDASTDILFAANELQAYLALSSGVELPIVTDESVNYSQSAKLISVGENAILTQAGFTIDKATLKNDGLRYVAKDKSLFLFGGSDIGTLYSVYEYMGEAINFETYSLNTTVYDENVKVLPLYDYDVTSIPSFEKRIAGNGMIKTSATALKRFRQSNYVDAFIFVNGREVHNALNYLPFDEYVELHPDWYSTTDPNANDGSLELCYTAHGNEQELTAMVETVAEVMKNHLKQYDGNIITFTQRDNFATCGCTSCRESRAKYSSDAGAIIKICNRVNRIIRAWFETDEGRPYARDLKILFFAYRKTLGAPVVYDDAQGKYVPIDNEVICDDGVTAFMAPIELDYTKSIYDSTNTYYLETFKKWSVVSKEISLWLYQTNFNYFLAPYDNFGKMQELYQFCEELGVEFLFDQGQGGQAGLPTGFTQLKAYISAELKWDVNVNVSQLTNNFFANVYGPASNVMQTIYNEFRVNSELIKANNTDYGGSSSVYMNVLRQEFWPKNLLLKWRGMIKTSMELIDNLKETQPEIYDRYKTNIQVEAVWIDYLLYNLYIGQFDVNEKNAIKEELYDALLISGVSKMAEHSDVTNLLNELLTEE